VIILSEVPVKNGTDKHYSINIKILTFLGVYYNLTVFQLYCIIFKLCISHINKRDRLLTVL
jgi:hypothetical protein